MLLSDNDILRELVEGENLMIHPFKKKNVKGSSINLTASKYAWRVNDGETAIVGNKIVIPPHETVCIYTEESIWVSRRLSGTYHSKVSQVAEGLGHLSTTLDPQWLGLSLIAVPNHTARSIEITVGTTFVSLVLSYLMTPATKGKNENAPSRPDISSKFKLTEAENEYLREEKFRSYEGLKTAMDNSPDYKELTKDKDEYQKQKLHAKKEFKQTFWFPLIIGFIGSVTGFIGSVLIEVYFK